MSTTLTGEPQPKANGKTTLSEKRPVGALLIPDSRHSQTIFDYKDARGNLLYQNVRFPLVTDGEPVLSSKGKPEKTFRLRRPNGKGGWLTIPMMLIRCLIACQIWSGRSWTVRPYSSQRVKPRLMCC